MCIFMVFKQLKTMSRLIMLFHFNICNTLSFLTDIMNRFDVIFFFVPIQHDAYFFSFILFPSFIS